MINSKLEAETIARSKLNSLKLKAGIDLELLANDTIEFKYGWVFFYQSKEYVESGDISKLIGGNAPIIVDKFEEITFLAGTKKDIQFYIDTYIQFRNSWLS
jgi:hypothetical protein